MQSLSSLEREIFRSFFLLTDTNSMYICMHDDEIKLLGNTITSPKMKPVQSRSAFLPPSEKYLVKVEREVWT
jgi:hypothetical protein